MTQNVERMWGNCTWCTSDLTFLFRSLNLRDHGRALTLILTHSHVCPLILTHSPSYVARCECRLQVVLKRKALELVRGRDIPGSNPKSGNIDPPKPHSPPPSLLTSSSSAKLSCRRDLSDLWRLVNQNAPTRRTTFWTTIFISASSESYLFG